MISFYQRSVEENCFTKTEAPVEGGWIYLDGAGPEDLLFICELTGLHIADLSDALDHHELPRTEKIQNNTILFARCPIEKMGHLHTIPLTFLITPHYLITISPIKSVLLQEILLKKEPISSCKPSKLFLLILRKITQDFNAQIRRVRNNVMTQGKEMQAVESEDIFALTENEEILNQFLSSLSPLNRALEQLLNHDQKIFHSKADKEIDDIYNSVRQSEELCSILIKNIRSLRDSYQIVFANKLTKTIKLLTALTIIFSIPTMIASIYGMNVKLPIMENVHAFTILIALMFAISVLCGYWFYRKKWF